MGDLVSFIGLVVFVVSMWGIIRGQVRWLKITRRKDAVYMLLGSFVLAIIGTELTPPDVKAQRAAERAVAEAKRAEEAKVKAAGAVKAQEAVKEAEKKNATAPSAASDPPKEDGLTKTVEVNAVADKPKEGDRKGPVVKFNGKLSPPVLRVGEKLVVQFDVENKSGDFINGVRLFSARSWNKFTIVNVLPRGRFETGALGTTFYSDMKFVGTLHITIIAYPNEPGNYEFSFIPRTMDGVKLKDENGQDIIVGGSVAVIGK